MTQIVLAHALRHARSWLIFNVGQKNMWPFSKPKVKRYDWKKEQSRLWRELVPPGGQADTLQGELVRIAGKLSDQAFRNGNMNWDDEHELLWRFIGEKIGKDPIFTISEQSLIHENIETIIRDEACPNLNIPDNPYYYITEKVIDWCMAYPEPILHIKNPNLKR